MRYSEHHIEQYRKYHKGMIAADRPSVWLGPVESFAAKVGAQNILDYGCGISRGISRYSKYDVWDYDPGVSGLESYPASRDLVVCIHMLEHVEEQYIDAVLDHIKLLASKAVLIVVSTQHSTKVLPDGTPWHCLVRDARWWKKKLQMKSHKVFYPEKEYAAFMIK